MSIFSKCLLAFAGLVLTVNLQAQVERELRTKTDTLDVYESNAGQSTAVTILDFTTLSRAIFEPTKYLTNSGRNKFYGLVSGISCATITQGKDYGYIFLLKNGTNEVRLMRWARSQDFYTGSGHNTDPANAAVLVGTPYKFAGSNNTQTSATVSAQASDEATIDLITHVRFTINSRTVDLPCPTRIWTSPHAADPDNERRPGNPAMANFQRNRVGTTGPIYDPWSNSNRTGIDPTTGSALANIPSGYKAIGNFYYSFDYLGFIFGSRQIAEPGNSDCWVDAPTTGIYASPAGYAVPATTENTSVPTMVTSTVTDPATGEETTTITPGTVTLAAEGWNNGLPVMARYQALKAATANVFMNYVGEVNLVYRYLDGKIDNDDSEEGTTNGATGPTDLNPSQSDLWNNVEISKRKYLRALKYDPAGTTDQAKGLASNLTSVQLMGPSGWCNTDDGTLVKIQGVWTPVYDALNKMIDATGNNDPCGIAGSMDPLTPQPWAYALANTYYRTNLEPSKSGNNMAEIIPASSATCPGQNYVIMFPTGGFSDSTSGINQDAALIYADKQPNTGAIPPGVGGGVPQKNGGYPPLTGLPGSPSLTGTLLPLDKSFHPAALASVAAFANAATNIFQWGAPWEVSPAKTRSSANPGLQTLVVSVGIPGSAYCGSSHNLSTAAAHFFCIAAWADPKRTNLGYARWSPNKPGEDTSVVDGGKVHYYPSGNPTQLEDNFNSAFAYIVSGSASLSAPATPSTGARVTTQAYFGIFRTSRTPVWSGNLYSVGLKRSLNAAGTTETLTFYDSLGRNTVDSFTPTDALNQPILDENGDPLVVTGANDFEARHLWSAFDIFGNYLATDYANGVTPLTDGVLGATKLWSDRNIFTLIGTTKTDFVAGTTATPSALATVLVAQFETAGLFPTADDTAAKKLARVQKFINFFRGQHRNSTYAASKNRIDIMGDIVNSSPLGIELGSNNLSSLSGVSWPSTGTDPHVRLVLVGTNMGMLHCFVETAYAYTALATDTDKYPYVKATATEAWAFIPPDVLNSLFQVFLNDGVPDALPHTYTVDGNPTLFWEDKAPTGSPIGNTRVDANEDAIVVFGMRKGARSYYALSISGTNDDTENPTGTPGSPKFLWKLDPQTSTDETVQKMGASTAAPVFTYVSHDVTVPTAKSADGTLGTKTAVCFIPGGYANPEINARYRARTSPPITSTQGMGQSMLALNPRTGAVIKKWDWSDISATVGAINVGSIPSAVSPLGIFLGYPLTHRIYFADMKGQVMALETNARSVSTTGGTAGFRLDTSIMKNWSTTPRMIYSNSAYRFSTRPEVSLLDSGYPVPIAKVPPSSTNPNYSPMTAMVAIGSGDWNNPTDADESVSDGTITLADIHPLDNRMFVFADRQDSYNQSGVDTTGIPDDSLQEIKDRTATGTGLWTTTYNDDKVKPGTSTYLFKNKTGYYFPLLRGTLTSAYSGITHDKVLVSPLIKQGSIFFSIFNINGNTGFQCSSNTFTRTFRECDILRPLAISTQTTLQTGTVVGDTDTLTKNTDTCTGLAFYFNSLASEMTDTGDRVIQGGAVTAASTASFGSQAGSNTASLQNVKNTTKQPGFKLRSWRVVH